MSNGLKILARVMNTGKGLQTFQKKIPLTKLRDLKILLVVMNIY
jgi:hypothetical protein